MYSNIQSKSYNTYRKQQIRTASKLQNSTNSSLDQMVKNLNNQIKNIEHKIKELDGNK